MNKNVGVHAIAHFLPGEVRTNDWWPHELVESWRRREGDLLPDRALLQNTDPAVACVIDGIAKYNDDPFKGSKERHVLEEALLPSAMEAEAARLAMQKAGVTADDIDFILTSSFVPDHLATPNACALHKTLGLRETCIATTVDAVCNSFAVQLHMARALIGSGLHRRGLLVQSSCATRVVPKDAPRSAWFGDGASAAVVGPVSADHGVLSMAHGVDGEYYDALVIGVPGRRWYDEGRSWWHAADRKVTGTMVLEIAKLGKKTVDQALDQARVHARDVKFFAPHQSTPWMREVLQSHFGLAHARYVDTFSKTGGLMQSNVPVGLSMGHEQKSINDGDLVLCFSVGAGQTWTATVMRWGGRTS